MLSTFDSTKTGLSELLTQIATGKIQLPDFQRGWVWDDAHIRSLLVSIGRAFPIGTIMLLETGGAGRFQTRAVEGITLPGNVSPERLILDGQQRLTSLTQVLKLTVPVTTRDDKGREVLRVYYIDIERALSDGAALEDAIVSVDGSLTARANFGRDVVLDLSSPEKEFDLFHFPCNQILNSDGWEAGLHQRCPEKFGRYMDFRKSVLTAFRSYQVPVIELTKETSKEAVCLVFEKVNTGGVPLSVFELATATYAADGFNLRDDWYGRPGSAEPGRQRLLAKKALLKDVQPTEFLQGLSLLHTHEARSRDLLSGKTGKDVAAVSAKREHVLALPLTAYKKWAEELLNGFYLADQFLRAEGFHNPEFLPYRTQLIPLAATLTHLRERWMEPKIREKLAQWYWCGVLGEQYGGSTETRMALDLTQLLAWATDTAAPEPETVTSAGFQASRLDTLRTRTSAAYRGIYVLLQRFGSCDFFWKAKMVDLDRDEYKIDIHHIFPQLWCEQNNIPARVYNSIVNKTPVSYKANRMIGGKAPSLYLAQLQSHEGVRLSTVEQDAILESHLIDASALRSDNFEDFFAARKSALLSAIVSAMGKEPIVGGEAPSDDVSQDDVPNGGTNGELDR